MHNLNEHVTEVDDRQRMSAIFATALSGEKTRGSGGVVLCNKSKGTICYALVDEFESEELRERIRDMLSDEGTEYAFVVEEVDRTVDIWKIPRAIMSPQQKLIA